MTEKDNVGIGTTTPKTALHLLVPKNDGIRIQSGEDGFCSTRLEFYSDPIAADSEWRPGYISTDDAGGFTGVLNFYTNGTGAGSKTGDVLGISIQNGWVGIGGVSPPTATLHVNGNIKASLNDITGDNWMRFDSAGKEIGYDVAELFDTDKEVEPGDVLVIGTDMKLNKSSKPNDTSVAGIVSNTPAIVFEGSELQIAPEPFTFQKGNKPPVALTGRILTKVSTENGPIEEGDLLTTSSTPGHAMKAKPIGEVNGYPIYPQGCIVGKALEPLKEGKGKILVLVCLM